MLSIDKNIFNFKILSNRSKKFITSDQNTPNTLNLDSFKKYCELSFHRIWIVIKGSGRVRTHTKEIIITENNAYYFPPYSIVSTELSSDMELHYIDFSQSVSKMPISQLYNFNYVAEDGTFDLILKLAQSLCKIGKKDSQLCEIINSSAITNILSRFINTQNMTPDALYNAIDYISKHYNEPISISYLANLCDYSYTYFSMKFKKIFSQTPQEYIIDVRMTKSKQLLLLTHDSITEIGKKIGYPDPTHFSKIFKNLNGISPQKYRELYSKINNYA